MAYPGYGGTPGQPPYGGAPPPGPGGVPPPQGQGYAGQPGYGAQQQGFPRQALLQAGGYSAAPYGQQPGYGAPPQGPPGAMHGAPPPGAAASPPGMPPGMSPELYSWFVAVDQDNTGKIDAKELQQALTHANWTKFDESTCRHMIGLFDRDRSGTIDPSEFSQLWGYIQQWKGVFESIDRDRSGGIDANELHTALNQMGYRLSPAFSQMVVSKYDTVTHRQMKLDGYIQVCALLGSLTDAFRRRDTQMTGTININYEDFMTIVVSSRP